MKKEEIIQKVIGIIIDTMEKKMYCLGTREYYQ